MNWVVQTLTSSLGRKLIMALTGAFLCLFLVVHLIGNLQLLKGDGGEAFNKYAEFMGHNPLIQTVSIGNFFFILLHIFTSLALTMKNRKARPVAYAYTQEHKNSAWNSRNMGILGTVILIFLVVHLVNFWGKMKLTKFGMGDFVPTVAYGEENVLNLYATTSLAFQEWWLVALYVVCMVGLAFHLAHGFASMFQSLGLHHKKYNYAIKLVGYEFCILVPALFALIPVAMLLELEVDMLAIGGVAGVIAVLIGIVFNQIESKKQVVVAKGDAA